MLEIYLTVLVPFFATVAFFLSVWKFFEDRRRASRIVTVRADGSQLRTTNHSAADVYLVEAGYIDADWRARRARFEPAPGDDNTGKIPRNGTLNQTITLRTTLNVNLNAAFTDKVTRAHGWWARIATGELATTLSPWNLYGRLRVWWANRGGAAAEL